MGVLDRLAGWLGYARGPRDLGAFRGTGFAASEVSRLTASLATETRFINDQLRYDLRALRARSRQATKNNPFGRRFVKMVVGNVGGPKPFRLQAKSKFASGKFDEAANARIETAWNGWAKKGNCEITGRWAWNTLQRQILQVFATDGEVILRKYIGPEYGKHGVQFQLIDTDRLDEFKNASLTDGGAIHMGVEVNAMQRPVAYHLLKRKPSNWQSGGYIREYERVPAEEIIHLFIPEYAEQVRGIPWMYAALLNLVHMGAFEEAAVIAARVGAAQMGFIQSPDGGRTLAEQQGGAAGSDPQVQAEPGSFWNLPPGATMESWNPKYPDAAIEPFLKAIGRGVAIGLDVAYHNLSGNMEGVNYSSARIAELDERDAWLGLQDFMIDHLHTPFYDNAWLPMQVINGQLPFDMARLDKYRDVRWQGRRWAWVDPEKEVNASIKAIEARLTSRTRVVSETGEDFEELLEEIAAEEELADAKGVELSVAPLSTAGKPAADVKPEGDAAAGSTAAAAEGKARAAAEKRFEALAADVRALKERGAPPIHVDARSTINVPGAQVNNVVTPTPVEIKNTIEPAPVHVNNLPTPAHEQIIERDKAGDMKRVVTRPIKDKP